MTLDADEFGERTATDRRLLRLEPRDNVLTVIAPLEAGERVWVSGREVVVPYRLPLGHKVAVGDLPSGSKVVKYGVPIGSTTKPVALGEHVHTHNLRSDYLPTYLREDQARWFQSGHEGVSAQ